MKRTFYSLGGLLAASFLMLTLAGTVWAQPGPNARAERGVRADWQLATLADSLGLSDAQRAQVSTILSDHQNEARAWFQSHRASARAERMAFHTSHREALKEALGDVLTDEQEAKLEAALPLTPVGRRAAWSGRRGTTRFDRGTMRGNRGNVRGSRFDRASVTALWEQLDVTDEQRTQLQTLRETHQQEVRAWLQAHPDATREERAAFYQKHWQDGRAELESVLTPEQVQELDALRSQRPNRSPRNARPGGRMRG